jgi:hypothetical protein
MPWTVCEVGADTSKEPVYLQMVEVPNGQPVQRESDGEWFTVDHLGNTVSICYSLQNNDLSYCISAVDRDRFRVPSGPVILVWTP